MALFFQALKLNLLEKNAQNSFEPEKIALNPTITQNFQKQNGKKYLSPEVTKIAECNNVKKMIMLEKFI